MVGENKRLRTGFEQKTLYFYLYIKFIRLGFLNLETPWKKIRMKLKILAQTTMN